jgi:hypothetical protein
VIAAKLDDVAFVHTLMLCVGDGFVLCGNAADDDLVQLHSLREVIGAEALRGNPSKVGGNLSLRPK